jgi:hypothetical protein
MMPPNRARSGAPPRRANFAAAGARPLALAAALAMLAACAAIEDDAASAAGPPAAIVAEAGLAPLALRPGDPPTPFEAVAPKFLPAARPAPRTVVAQAARSQSDAPSVVSQTDPGRAAIQDDPDRLVGLEHSRIAGLFGTPSFVRRDAPAELWRYLSGGCIVDLYLYPTFNERAEAEGELRVRHVEVRAQTGGKTDVRACIGSLLAASPEDRRG